MNKKEELKKVVEMCGGQIKEESYAPDRIIMITQPEKDRLELYLNNGWQLGLTISEAVVIGRPIED